ncbi:MAG: hypothetical protein SFU98_21700 [Leptospiraceae bacterium]|nr:hypothetical protein [Leptospiraceae bacterium]
MLIIQFNCKTLGNYSYDRVRDAGDIFNIGIEKDVYGGSFFIDQVGMGLQHASKGNGIGMRYGHFGFYKTGSDARIAFVFPFRHRVNNTDVVNTFGNSMIIPSNSYEHIPMYPSIRNQKKLISISNIFCPCGNPKGRTTPSQQYYTIPKESRISYIFAPIEISFGLYIGVRIGFNPSEFFDFILGIFTIDIFEDDLGYTTETVRIRKIRNDYEVMIELQELEKQKKIEQMDKDYELINSFPGKTLTEKLKNYSISLEKEKSK